MRGIRNIWILLFFASTWYQVSGAPAIVGGELSYTYLGNNKYAIRVIAYRDCSGNQLSYFPIAITPAGGTTFYKGYGPSGGLDITPVCKRSCTKCLSPSCTFGFGFEEYYVDDTVDLSSYSQCVFTFSWKAGVRSSAITTGAASTTFYVEAVLNRCNVGDHSSATFSQPPRFILDKAFCARFYENGKAEEGDSLIYEQVDPMTAASTSVSYSTSYSKEEPIRYSGYPTKTWKESTCEGIRFDKFTGRLDFKPTKNEVSVFAFRMHQYRKDSTGKYQEIGTVMREYRVNVENADGNRYPVFGTYNAAKPENVVVCQDEAADFIIQAFDPDIDDTVTMTGDKNLPGATFDRKGKWAVLKWVPDSEAVRNAPYEILLTAKDDACPMPGIAQQRYLIYVKKPFPKYKYAVADSGCGWRYFSVTHDTTESFTYKWWIDGKDAGTAGKWAHRFPKNGNYIVKLQLTAASGCLRTFYETVTIKDLADYGAGPDTFICKGDSLQLRAKGGIKYIWRDRDNTVSNTGIASPYAKPYRFTRYYVDILDSNGCWYTDSTSVNIFDYKVLLTKNTTIFKEDPKPLALSGFKMDGAKYLWWTKEDGVLDSLHNFIYVKPSKQTVYHLRITPFVGCPKIDSVTISVDSIVADAGPSKVICYGQSVKLEASGGQYYQWDAAPGISDYFVSNPTVSPTADQVYWVTVYKGGFSKRDSVFVKVNKLTTFAISPVTICPGDSVQLHAFGGQVYSWSPNIRIENPGKPKPLVFPKENITYTVKITDTVTGCSATEKIEVIVSKDCVRPGDANKDGIVNYIDLLHLGVGFGESGPNRAIVSTNWKAYASSDWNKVSGAGIDYKYFDFNGDGKINSSDTTAFVKNYGKTFEQSSAIYPGVSSGFDFRFEKDTFYAGDLVKAGLYMSDPNPGFYGIGLQYRYKDQRIVPGSYKFTFVERAGHFDLTSHRITKYTEGEAAIIGTNQKNEFRNGKIASIEFQLQDSTYFPWAAEFYDMGINRVIVTDSIGKLYEAEGGDASMLVLRNHGPVSVNELKELEGMISIYPNPASASLFIKADGVDIKGIILSDMLGREILRKLGNKESTIEINTSAIAAGMYMIRVETGKGPCQQKIIKQ